MADRDLGSALLALARGAIGAEFGFAATKGPAHPALERPGATFVTLRQGPDLRGCIGSLEPRRMLAADVCANALAAAFHDPRFSPLCAREFAGTAVEVSLLSAAEPLAFDDEAHLLQQLRPGLDGVVLHWKRHRATFLPQVWDTLPQPRAFVAALREKAGIAAEVRTTALNVARYTVVKWTESEFDAALARP